MIDGGVGLNIYSLSLVKALGYMEDVVDPQKRIIIKAYDEQERSYKGMLILPILVGPITK